MRKLTLAAACAAITMTLTTSAFALNPQPEPPGKNRVMFVPKNKLMIGSQTGGAGAGKFADDYCGTQVPGHIPHNVGSVRGGSPADYDDTYCGTRVPGHGPIHYGVSNIRFNAHASVMLNPQPLPPGAKAGRTRYGE